MRWPLILLLVVLAACMERPSGVPPDRAPARRGETLAGLDREVFRATNQARQSNGRPPTRWSRALAAVAARHSADMARRGYFDHLSPDGLYPTDRAVRGGVRCRVTLAGGRTRTGVLENLYQSTRYRGYRDRTQHGRTVRTWDWYTSEDLAQRAVRGWLASTGHRRNLLDPSATSQGVGAAVGAGQRVYVTQVLC